MFLNKHNLESLQVQNNIIRPVLVVFDFDGTLTDRHTFWRYIRFIHGSCFFWRKVLLSLPQIIAVLLKITPVMKARRKFIYYFFSNLDVRMENTIAKHYVEEYLPHCLRPEAIRRLHWHQSQGHLVALVCNSPENYLKIWGEKNNLDIVCGTRLASDGKKFNGFIMGNDCVGDEKVRRLREAVPNLDEYQIYVYGDSSGDTQILDIATIPFYRNWY